MKNLFLTSLFLIIGIGFFVSPGFAEENNKAWVPEYIKALQEGKAMIKSGGLSEETVLAEAVKQAIVINNAPAYQAMKIAVDLKYDPYFVIKNIFSHGGDIDLNQLCLYATKYGINKLIFIKASKDAVSPLGEPVFSRDELAQCKCMQEIGLGYHEPVAEMPDAVTPPPKPAQFSKSSPT
ncbi:MAG: hypothetical protein PF690_10715 [Deltaproteobacteria bacterium]|jgi:hypothetical protein|nr:hypothetical protein [Deltaproteobacteria bacterium]